MTNDILRNINKRLNKCLLSPKHCLNRFKVGNEEYRLSAQYTDPTNFPAYYVIGSYIQPKSLFDIGFHIGLEPCCLMEGCKTVETFFGFHPSEKNYWSSRIARANTTNSIRCKVGYWYGKVSDPEFMKAMLTRKWDCVLITAPNQNEVTYREYLEVAWQNLSLDGLIVMDYVGASKEAISAYKTACQIFNRESMIVNSRYGIGLISK